MNDIEKEKFMKKFTYIQQDMDILSSKVYRHRKFNPNNLITIADDVWNYIQDNFISKTQHEREVREVIKGFENTEEPAETWASNRHARRIALWGTIGHILKEDVNFNYIFDQWLYDALTRIFLDKDWLNEFKQNLSDRQKGGKE